MINSIFLKDSIDFFLKEDDLAKNFQYLHSLPSGMVDCEIKFKDNLTISGIPFFFEVLNYISDVKINYSQFNEYENKDVKKEDNFVIKFQAPFNVVLCAERLALNLLQRSSSITTHTKSFIEKAKNHNVSILDTRKTTPGLRFLEKYATQVGGAKNHRFSQNDVWMIKDNHKNYFGGVKEALEFFSSVNSFYTPIVVEVHGIEELKLGLGLNIKHFMLDNFSPSQVKEAIELKTSSVSYEVSGGITLDNIDTYLIEGVDAISSGSLTYGARQVDISLKYHRTQK